LAQPLLYLSLYFKQHRDNHYAALQRVRTHGDWEGWMSHYLERVDCTARQANQTTTDLLALFRTDRARFAAGARGAGTMRVYDVLQQKVFVSIKRLAESAGVAVPTATRAMNRLLDLGIAQEMTGGKYGKLFAYERQLKIMNRTEIDG